jgi:hypothetical protein
VVTTGGGVAPFYWGGEAVGPRNPTVVGECVLNSAIFEDEGHTTRRVSGASASISMGQKSGRWLFAVEHDCAARSDGVGASWS